MSIAAADIKEFIGRDVMVELSTGSRAIDTKTDITGKGEMVPVIWTVPEQVSGTLEKVSQYSLRIRTVGSIRILPLTVICGMTIFSSIELAKAASVAPSSTIQ